MKAKLFKFSNIFWRLCSQFLFSTLLNDLDLIKKKHNQPPLAKGMDSKILRGKIKTIQLWDWMDLGLILPALWVQ